MPDTFLSRLGYVLNPTVGDPRNAADRAGTFVAWLVTLYVNGVAGATLPPPPAFLPAWVAPILVVLSTLLTAYHVSHPATAQGLAAQAAPAVGPGPGPPSG